MGPHGPDAPPTEPAMPGSWCWQVYSHTTGSSPPVGQGRADSEDWARQMAEEQMLACGDAFGAVVIGPHAEIRQCTRNTDRQPRWLDEVHAGQTARSGGE